MKIKDMTDDELRALILYTLRPGQPAQSQPRTPRLVEAVEAYFSASDTDISFLSKKMNYHGQVERDVMRLALAAEKKRSELVEAVIDVTREQAYINRRRGVQSKFTEVIDALDAYEKGE